MPRKRDPVSFIELCVIPLNLDDSSAEPTQGQIELLEPFQVSVERAVHQYRPLTSRSERPEDGYLDGRRVIANVRRAMLTIRPDKLRALFNDVTWEVATRFEDEWKEHQRRKWRNDRLNNRCVRETGFSTWKDYQEWLKGQGILL